jgi:hypothetical protein
MSKKHFELLAQAISRIQDPHCRREAAVAVSSACHIANPRFDCDRFPAACNLSAGEVR